MSSARDFSNQSTQIMADLQDGIISQQEAIAALERLGVSSQRIASLMSQRANTTRSPAQTPAGSAPNATAPQNATAQQRWKVGDTFDIQGAGQFTVSNSTFQSSTGNLNVTVVGPNGQRINVRVNPDGTAQHFSEAGGQVGGQSLTAVIQGLFRSQAAGSFPRSGSSGGTAPGAGNVPLDFQPGIPGQDTSFGQQPLSGPRTLEDIFGIAEGQRGAFANAIGQQFPALGGSFRSAIDRQSDALNQRFQLQSLTRPEGAAGGFQSFLSNLGSNFGSPGGFNQGLLAQAANLLTPGRDISGLSNEQQGIIEAFRGQPRAQFNLALDPTLASLSPYARGGFATLANRRFESTLGSQGLQPGFEFLPHFAQQGFRF